MQEWVPRFPHPKSKFSLTAVEQTVGTHVQIRKRAKIYDRVAQGKVRFGVRPSTQVYPSTVSRFGERRAYDDSLSPCIVAASRDRPIVRSDHSFVCTKNRQGPRTDHRFESGAQATDAHSLSGR